MFTQLALCAFVMHSCMCVDGVGLRNIYSIQQLFSCTALTFELLLVHDINDILCQGCLPRLLGNLTTCFNLTHFNRAITYDNIVELFIYQNLVKNFTKKLKFIRADWKIRVIKRWDIRILTASIRRWLCCRQFQNFSIDDWWLGRSEDGFRHGLLFVNDVVEPGSGLFRNDAVQPIQTRFFTWR